VGIADAISGIFLDAIGETLAVHVRGDAIDEDVTYQVRSVMHLVVAVEVGDLVVDVFHRFLVTNDVEIGEFILPLVEQR